MPETSCELILPDARRVGCERRPAMTQHPVKPRQSRGRCVVLALAVLAAVGCDGPQSALSPAGEAAAELAQLFYVMATGAAVIWLIVVGIALYSLLRPETGSRRKAAISIIGGGVLFPTVILTALLAYGLSSLADLVAPAPDDAVNISVVGYQWWWRVQYETDDGTVELANEIHLPVDRPVAFHLESGDVVHAFWIPSLGGKVDMIPGRATRLKLAPTKTGVYRGVCAEFCGSSHALMAFPTVVESPEAFTRWLEDQAAPAQAPDSLPTQQGAELFARHGCGACHRIRGTTADGSLGPDLTHVGSRQTLAAGTLPNEPASFARWIQNPSAVKPDAKMPRFDMLPAAEIEAIAAYLDSLQ